MEGLPPDTPTIILVTATITSAFLTVLVIFSWPRRGTIELVDAAKRNALMKESPTSSGTTTGATAAGSLETKNEETGTMEAPESEAVASAFALVRRVRALGLFLGDFTVSGVSLGLPNAASGRPVFSSCNIEAIMKGENFISSLPPAQLQAQLDRNIVQVVKKPGGLRERRPLLAVREVIQLASRIGKFDLAAEFGIDEKIVETLDTTYALAVGAGLDALRKAGLIPQQAAGGAGAANSPKGWKLEPQYREDTGVIFAASFPALDSLVDELATFMASRLERMSSQAQGKLLDELDALILKLQGQAGEIEGRGLQELSQWLSACRQRTTRMATDAEPDATGAPLEASDALPAETDAAKSSPAAGAVCSYEFNRKLLFKLLVMANSQLAELVQARGPNLHINAACAGTTAAITLACDWMRAGRCQRVVVISADNPSSDNLMPWVGIGFLALGAATVQSNVSEAALPFDRRRNGLILGAGAVGLVLETDIAAASRSTCTPLAKVLGTTHANSAYHASAIATKHACEQLERLLVQVEVTHGITRKQLAESLLYVSHETFTCARGGGCAGSEVAALRSAFGSDMKKILITNTKGMTGHAMAVCYEDVLAVAALSTGQVPPIVNFRDQDPVLGQLRWDRLLNTAKPLFARPWEELSTPVSPSSSQRAAWTRSLSARPRPEPQVEPRRSA